MGNGFAQLVAGRGKKGKDGKTVKRRKLDDYETPGDDPAVEYLCRHVQFRGPMLEPAAGSGRMARSLLTWTGRRVTTADIKRGQDFLKRTKKWPGNIVTNPPYRDNLAEAFARKAIELADGKVAMLVQVGFLSGARRPNGLFAEFKPCKVIYIPHRIRFFEGGGTKRIKSQFFSHAWVVWPARALRKMNATCEAIWIPTADEIPHYSGD